MLPFSETPNVSKLKWVQDPPNSDNWVIKTQNENNRQNKQPKK